MKSFRKLKPGDTISCVVEDRIENGLLVRYECKNGNKNPAIFRGVLIDKQKPSVKRFIPPTTEKPALTEKAVESFIQSFQSQHISGKFLRNKNKPSCLVLDEYHLNLRYGLGQQITVGEDAKKPGNKDAVTFVKSRQSKFKLDDLYTKSLNVSAGIPSVPKKSARAPRKPKKTLKIIKENSQLKFVNGLEKIAEKEQKELRRPINFFGEKLLESCEILEGSDESTSELEERNKLLRDEGYRKDQSNKNKVKDLDASVVIEPESKTLTPAETYFSPRINLKRSFEAQNDKSCSEKLGIRVDAKKIKTDAKELRNGPKTKRRRRRKEPAVHLERVLVEECKYKLRRRAKKEKHVPKDDDTTVSLFCDEPPLDYVTDEEENVNLEINKQVSASVRKKAEKILKGKISLLAPNQANLLARPLPRSIPGGSNMMPFYYLVPVSNENVIINSGQTPISASMPDQNNSNLINPCRPMEDAQSVQTQANNAKNATQESYTNSKNVAETPSNSVSTTMGQLSGCIGNKLEFVEKSQKTSKPRKKRGDSKLVTKSSEDATSKASVKKINAKGIRKKKPARNSSQEVKKTLNRKEEQVIRPRKAAECKVTGEQQESPGLFDKTLISQCLENFNNDSSSVKNQTSAISNDKTHSLTPSDKKRKTIDPFAYSKISFQRLVNSARKEIVDKEVNALKNDAEISPGKESRKGCLNVSDSDDKSAEVHIEEVHNDPEEASVLSANELVGHLRNGAVSTESIPTDVSKTAREKAEGSGRRGVNAGTFGRVSVKAELLDSSSSTEVVSVSMVQASIANQSKREGITSSVHNLFSDKDLLSNDNGLVAPKAKARTVKLEPPDSSSVDVFSEDVFESTEEASTCTASNYLTQTSQIAASDNSSFRTGTLPSNTNAYKANEAEIPTVKLEPSSEKSGKEAVLSTGRTSRGRSPVCDLFCTEELQSKGNALVTCNAEIPEVEIPAVASRSCSSAVKESKKKSRSNARISIADKSKRKSRGTSSVFSVFAGRPLPSKKHIFVSQNPAILAVKSEPTNSSIEKRSKEILATSGGVSPADASERAGVLAPFYAVSSDRAVSSNQNAMRDSQADRSSIAAAQNSFASTTASKPVEFAVSKKSEITNTTVATNTKSSASGLLRSLSVLESYDATRPEIDRFGVGNFETPCRGVNNQNQLATGENLDSQTSEKVPNFWDTNMKSRKDEQIRSKPSSSRRKMTTNLNYVAKNYDVAVQVALKNINFGDILKLRTEKTNPGPGNESLALRVALKNLERPCSDLDCSTRSDLTSGENRGFVEQEQREKRRLLEQELRENHGLLEQELRENHGLLEQEQRENCGLLEQEQRENHGLLEKEQRENCGLLEQEQRENRGLLEQQQRNCRFEIGDKLCIKPSISIRRKNVFKLEISRNAKPSSLSRSGINNIEKKLIENIFNQKMKMCCRVEGTLVNQGSRNDNEETTIACNISQYRKHQNTEKIANSLLNGEITRISRSVSDQVNMPYASISSQSNVPDQALSDRTSATGVALLPDSVIIKKEPIDHSDIEPRANPTFCGLVTGGKSPVRNDSCLHQGTKSQTIQGRKGKRKTVLFKTSRQKVKYPRVFQKPETVRKICDNYKQTKGFVDNERTKKPELDTSKTNLVSDRGKELVEQMLRLNQNILSHKNQAGQSIGGQT